jgi:hypothetical protein
MTVAIGPGWTIGAGWTIDGGPTVVTTSQAQNVTGVPNAQGFFFAVLNRGEQGWDFFAANGNNGNWTATGDFGSGTVTIPVLSVPQDADSVYPIVSGGLFQPGFFYTFQGY